MIKDPWNQCLRKIKKKIQPQSFETWFAQTSAKTLTRQEVIIEVPNSFFADWLEEHYTWLIQGTIEEEFSWKPRLIFAIKKTDKSHQVRIDFPRQTEQQQVEESDSPKPRKEISASSSPISLNPRYRFDNFVVGESNEVSFSAAQAVAEAPGQTAFNPLVLYGDVGLGKTHILQAIGDFCLQNRTAQNVVYATAEKFFSDYLAGVERRDTSEFHKLYRNADILLVDDIQFYVKTEACQREFIHTFNTIYQNDKQIVISSDRPPALLEGFEDRLISRFQWGLETEIAAPDLETRKAILRQKAEELAVALPEQVVGILAEEIESNIRELEGVLKRLLAVSNIKNRPITVELAQTICQTRPRSKPAQLSIERIKKATAAFFQVPIDKIVGATRKQEITIARHVGMYLSKSLTGAPLKTIGIQFGNRDHSTVIHACRTVEKKLAGDPGFGDLLTRLENEITR
ncbi:MAG: chromosomal replication initiator protein DnaA [bacterium]|nr:chromosomal replication initiator protein DnaA [bacterium]